MGFAVLGYLPVRLGAVLEPDATNETNKALCLCPGEREPLAVPYELNKQSRARSDRVALGCSISALAKSRSGAICRDVCGLVVVPRCARASRVASRVCVSGFGSRS